MAAVGSHKVVIAYDDLADVMSAYVAGSRASSAGPAPHDGHLILEIADDGEVVGVELLSVSALIPRVWRTHPDRGRLPQGLLGEIDRWLAHRWADEGRLR